MHRLSSPSPARLHVLFVAAAKPKPATTPEVCPKLTPAAWAKAALNFDAEPKQAEVLDHHAHRLILCCPRQWGKSTIISIKALHYALQNPKSEILVLSDSEDHAGIIVEKIATYAAAIEIPRRRAHGKRYSLELPNGSRIFAVAHNQSSGVGYTANIVIVDEAALVDDQVLSYVSRVLTRTNGRLWLIGTPPRPDRPLLRHLARQIPQLAPRQSHHRRRALCRRRLHCRTNEALSRLFPPGLPLRICAAAGTPSLPRSHRQKCRPGSQLPHVATRHLTARYRAGRVGEEATVRTVSPSPLVEPEVQISRVRLS